MIDFFPLVFVHTTVLGETLSQASLLEYQIAFIGASGYACEREWEEAGEGELRPIIIIITRGICNQNIYGCFAAEASRTPLTHSFT